MDFKGKIAFVPGGSSGIGLAIARQLYTLGADVIIFSRDEGRLVNAVKEIRSLNRHKTSRVDFRALDVSRHEAVSKVMDEAVETFGKPDILINCAGRSYPGYFEDISYQQFDETMKINLYGIWNVTAILFPHMKEKGGHIINVSSLAGFVGVFGFTDYSASKFGIMGFSESLRSEGKQYGIKVSVLCPADTDTPSFAVENSTKPPETKAVSEAANLYEPAEIADALCKKNWVQQLSDYSRSDAQNHLLFEKTIPGSCGEGNG